MSNYSQKFRSLFLIVAFLFVNAVTAHAQRSLTQLNVKGASTANVIGFIEQAQSHERERDFHKAIENYEKALRFVPDNAKIYSSIGIAYAKLQQFEKALPAFQKSIEFQPEKALSHYNLSVVLRNLSRQSESLIHALKAAEAEPKNVNFVINVCELHIELRNDKKAVACYQNLIEFAPATVRIQSHYGLALMRAKRSKQALAILTEATRRFPDDYVVYNALGMALLEKKKFKKSIEPLMRSIALNPQYQPAQYNLALARLATGNRAAALRTYQNLRDSNPALALKLYKILYRDKVIYVGDRRK